MSAMACPSQEATVTSHDLLARVDKGSAKIRGRIENHADAPASAPKFFTAGRRRALIRDTPVWEKRLHRRLRAILDGSAFHPLAMVAWAPSLVALAVFAQKYAPILGT
jgi:hypothetical protein